MPDFLGGEERLEHVGEMLSGDPASRVAHADDGTRGFERFPVEPRPDLHLASALDSIQGIV